MQHYQGARVATLLALSAMLSMACRDSTPTQSGSQPKRLANVAPTKPAAGPIEEVPLDSRFEVALTATGTFVPNVPIQLRATARANIATKGATLKITLPEVELARANGWQLDQIIPYARVPAAALGHHAIPVSAIVSEQAAVSIAKPGLYSAVATVVADSAEPGVVNGHFVQNAAHVMIWLLIDERGGRVLSTYDPAVIPPGMNDDHAGPWRVKGAGSSPPGSSSPSESPGLNSTSGDIWLEAGPYDQSVDHMNSEAGGQPQYGRAQAVDGAEAPVIPSAVTDDRPGRWRLGLRPLEQYCT
jgi:hypothetical protein